MKKSNSVGVVFIENLGFATNGNKLYLCKCPKCGNEYKTYASDYYMNRNGCQCKWLGKTNPRLYRIWVNMKTRCYNPKASGYINYGGRGIEVCFEMSLKRFCIENNINYKTVHTRKMRHPELNIEEVVKMYLDRAIKEIGDEE